jgi:hypothetical protein
MNTHYTHIKIALLSFIIICFLCSAVQLQSEKLVPDKNRMKPDHAPTPFSAEEIYKGCPSGRITKYLIEIPGKPKHFSISKFVNSSESGTDFEGYTTDLEGKRMGDKQTSHAKWIELQAHASFPEIDTTISSETIKIPAGEFACLLYTVKSTKGLKKLWFAKKLPGPPVKFEQFQEGKRVYYMVLVK